MKTLKTTLLVNAISSGATGALLLVLSDAAAGLFAIQATAPFIEIGLFLLAFAAFVLTVALRPQLSLAAVKLITVLDTIWVLASVVAVVLLFPVISGVGTAAIIAVAGWVALMAYLQNKGVRAVA